MAAGAGGAALTLLLHAVQHLAFGYTEQTFLVGVERASGLRRVLVLALAGVVAGLGWWALRARARPVRRVTAAVDGAPLPLLPVALDACLQVVVVALGASLGREGAPRQLGAALGSLLGERCGLGPQERRLLLACGAGAGLAAVYDVPVGGTLFTLEVLLRSRAPRVVVPAVVTAGLATAVAALVLPGGPTYALSPGGLTGSAVVAALLGGPLLAVAAVAFTRLTDAAAAARPSGWRLPLATVPVFTALGLLAVPYPQLLGNGKGLAQLALDGALPLSTLLALVLLKPLVTAACLGSGAAGGRLTPAIATGALLGLLLGRGWVRLWPGPGPGELAVVGATAFLAVTLRAPLTALALVVELAAPGPALVVPVVCAVATAQGTVLLARRRLRGRAHGG